MAAHLFHTIITTASGRTSHGRERRRGEADAGCVPKLPSPKIPWWSSAEETIPVVVRARLRERVKRFVLLFFLVLPVALAALSNPATATRSVAGGGLREPATIAGLANGCTGVTRWQGSDADGFVDQPLYRFVWQVTPPANGNFAMTPWDGPRASFVVSETSPNVPQVLASVYRGSVAIWYNSANTDAVPQLLNDATELADEFPNLIIAPWPLDEDSVNPWRSPRPIVFTAWGLTLGCLTYDRTVLLEFMEMAAARETPDVALGDAGPQAYLVTRPTD